MDKKLYNDYVEILNTELIPALGCTEPIALAYAAAQMRKTLGHIPESMNAHCSGNIIKNVKGVKVPNSGGLKGVEAAVILGMVGGNAEKALEVLADISDADREETIRLLKEKICSVSLEDGVPNLFIEVSGRYGDDEAMVRIEDTHTNITHIEKNGEVLFEKEKVAAADGPDKSGLKLDAIIDFANEVDLSEVAFVLNRQMEYNFAISEEGLKNDWGARVGKTSLASGNKSLRCRAICRAAAGSDARMGGCALPVVINSGSGNQGMTCSLPVMEYAHDKGISKEKLMRALCISNLFALDQKKYIGSLSAYCGAVCAAAGAGAAITYLAGGTKKQIENTVVTTIATVGGMVCDGAKASCAGKIYTALHAAYMAHEMAMCDTGYESGDGLVMDSPEDTVKALGCMGRCGMRGTDLEILNIMIGKTEI